MATKRIPDEQNRVRQSNRDELSGEFINSWNLDLTSNPGKIKSARKLQKVLDTTTDLAGERIHGFATYLTNYYLVANTDGLYKCSVDNDPTDSANWSADANFTETPTDYSDITVFNNLILVSTNTNIHSFNGSTQTSNYWTTTLSGTALTTSYPHILSTVASQKETLFVTDKNFVRYYEKGGTTQNVELDGDQVACCLAPGVGAMWVGTYSSTGNSARVYEVHPGDSLAGGTPVYRQSYKIDGKAVLSIEVVNNTPYIVTNKGEIQVFNGVGFTTVASFPFAYTDEELNNIRPGVISSSNRSRPIHPKGMTARNGSIFILLNAEEFTLNNPVTERTPSGLWEFDTITGNLNHIGSTSLSTDYGEQLLEDSGPIHVVDRNDTRFLVGCGSLNSSGMFAYIDASNKSYFITPEIESNSIADTWEHVTLKAKTLSSGERIVVKYRISKDVNYPQYNDITWVDGTTFTTTDATFSNVSVGDEIEVTSGDNAGQIAHITAIDGTTTFTVTIDESIGTLNQTSRIRVQNWILIDDEYTSVDGEYKTIGVNVTAPWIQFKVMMDGKIELRRMIIKSNNKEGV